MVEERVKQMQQINQKELKKKIGSMSGKFF